MATKFATNQYQIPRGRVFFDPFDTNGDRTGERYFGNCPSFTLSIETEKAEHFSSETGLRQKDQSIVIEVNRTAELTCDNMSAEVVALFLSGSEEMVSQTSTPVAAEAIDGVLPGRFYQLGQTLANPAGARKIAAVVVEDDTTPTPVTFTVDIDYEVDAALGRIRVVPGGAITAGTNLRIDYTKTAETWQRIKTGSDSELKGALRVVSDNASGANRDFYMPEVTLTPSGELPIIAEGTDFASVGFTVEALKPQNAEAIYIDGRPV